MLLAEELECDWKKIRTEFPGVDREYGGQSGVVGSQSIRTSSAAAAAGATARKCWCRPPHSNGVSTGPSAAPKQGASSTRRAMPG